MLPYRKINDRTILFAGDVLISYLWKKFYVYREGQWVGPHNTLFEAELEACS